MMPARIRDCPSDDQQRRVKALAQQLRLRRKALGVTVQAAADAAGMSRDTWHRMERGVSTVTIAAWFNALAVLGLRFGIAVDDDDGRADGYADGDADGDADADPGVDARSAYRAGFVPLEIALADFPQLAALAWQMPDRLSLTPREAFDVYERNARHLERAQLTPQERALIESLQRPFEPT